MAANEYARGKNDTTGVLERKRVGAMMEQTIQAEHHRSQSHPRSPQSTLRASGDQRDSQEESYTTSAVITHLTTSYIPHTFHGSQIMTGVPLTNSHIPSATILTSTPIKAAAETSNSRELRDGNLQLSMEAVTGLRREIPQQSHSIPTSGFFGSRIAGNRPATYEEMDWLLDESAVLGRFGSEVEGRESEGEESLMMAKQALEVARLKYEAARDKSRGVNVRGSQETEKQAWDVVLIAQLRYADSLARRNENQAHQAIEVRFFYVFTKAALSLVETSTYIDNFIPFFIYLFFSRFFFSFFSVFTLYPPRFCPFWRKRRSISVLRLSS